MHRCLNVLFALLGIGLLGADPSPAPAPSPAGVDSVTILNSTDAGGHLELMQTAFVSAKVAAALDAAGVVIAREDTGVRTLEKDGSAVCVDARTPTILVPTVRTLVTGRDQGTGEYDSVTVEIATFDCTSHAIKRVTSGTNSSFGWTPAAEKSIADAVKRYLAARPH
jgi:hypothetical protein